MTNEDKIRIFEVLAKLDGADKSDNSCTCGNSARDLYGPHSEDIGGIVCLTMSPTSNIYLITCTNHLNTYASTDKFFRVILKFKENL